MSNHWNVIDKVAKELVSRFAFPRVSLTTTTAEIHKVTIKAGKVVDDESSPGFLPLRTPKRDFLFGDANGAFRLAVYGDDETVRKAEVTSAIAHRQAAEFCEKSLREQIPGIEIIISYEGAD